MFHTQRVSWRRMLVSQPPPPLLGYFLLDLHSGWNQISTAMVEPSCGGLHMGELYDIVQYHSGHHKSNSMWFRVTRRGLRLRFMFDIQKGIYQEMMNKTNVSLNSDILRTMACMLVSRKTWMLLTQTSAAMILGISMSTQK